MCWVNPQGMILNHYKNYKIQSIKQCGKSAVFQVNYYLILLCPVSVYLYLRYIYLYSNISIFFLTHLIRYLFIFIYPIYIVEYVCVGSALQHAMYTWEISIYLIYLSIVARGWRVCVCWISLPACSVYLGVIHLSYLSIYLYILLLGDGEYVCAGSARQHALYT